MQFKSMATLSIGQWRETGTKSFPNPPSTATKELKHRGNARFFNSFREKGKGKHSLVRALRNGDQKRGNLVLLSCEDFEFSFFTCRDCIHSVTALRIQPTYNTPRMTLLHPPAAARLINGGRERRTRCCRACRYDWAL